jgi:poly [ADP-ribose] polymerase 2/3/4
LLLCEAELGDPMQNLTGAHYNAGDDAKAKGMLSTWGQGQTGPSKWKDAECVHPALKGVRSELTQVLRTLFRPHEDDSHAPPSYASNS